VDRPTMNTMANNAWRALAALSLSLVLGLAHAQDTESAPTADPPDRAARLSYIQGDVSLQPAGEQDWAAAIVNRPLTTGDKLWTEQNARAEIYVGEAAVRLGSNTGFSFLNVDDDTVQMRMTAGVINVRVRALDGNDHIEIDTPNIALSLLRPGNYRVEVNDAGDTTVVKVSEGEAEATGGSHDSVVHAQQVATFRGTDQLTAQLGRLGGPDEFDSWSLERDRRDDQAASSPSAQYVAPEVTGYQDLDRNGSWHQEPEYGYVWTPSYVAAGWAPYQYGRWVWVAPWGWTWVDDAPWGYAPFHYGRWAYAGNRWCWVPGPRHVHAVYAPALVGWVGSPGVSVSVSFGGGGVAWFPLGPREVYVPARRFSPHYVERVNVSNTVIVNRTYITNVYENRMPNMSYRNRGVPGAVTAVSRETFVSAGRVADHRVRISESDITRTRVTGAAPRIEPGRESRLGGATRANFRPPPRAVVDRQVIVKREPPPASAHFARGAAVRNDSPPPAERSPRTQDFGRPSPQNPNEPVVRNRAERVDRPPNSEHTRDVATPAPEVTRRPQPTAPDQRAVAEPQHNDRPPRDVREHPQTRQEPDPRAVQQQQDQQYRQQEFQRQQAAQRQDRERAQREQEYSQHQHDAQRQEDAQRQQEAARQHEAQRQQPAAHPQEQRPPPQQQPQQPRAERPHPDKPDNARSHQNPRDDHDHPQQQ